MKHASIHTNSLTPFANMQSVVGVCLLLCALTFYYFAVLRIDYSKTTLLDLDPHPDATEYFAQAKALHRDGWPSIQIGYDKLPSRFPFGYPVLMLPWLNVLPRADAVLAPFRTNQTLGLLLLIAVFGFYAYLAMPLTGGFAALLLATLPGFFTFCRSSLSEISASVLIVLAFLFAYLGLKQEHRWKIYLSAVLLGLTINIRLQSLFFAPLLMAMALFPARGMRLRWFLHCAAVPVTFLLAASPLLIFNTLQFHSPFKTGYDFWVPFWSEHHLLFTRGYIPINAAILCTHLTLRPVGFYAANIFGTGTCFVPAFIVLICIGVFFIRITRFVICAFLGGLGSFVASLSYKYGADARFYLPLLILLVAVAVLPVTWAATNLRAGKRIIASWAILILFGAACVGYPSHSGYNTLGIHRSQAWDALHFTAGARESIAFMAQEDFAGRFAGAPGIVLSDIDPVYLDAFWPRSLVGAPIDGKHHYKWSYTWRYDLAQAVALVEHGLNRSLPVYALFVSRDEMTAKRSRLPSLSGYEWQVLNDSAGKATILKLVRAGPDREQLLPMD